MGGRPAGPGDPWPLEQAQTFGDRTLGPTSTTAPLFSSGSPRTRTSNRKRPLAVTAVWTAAALPALLPIHPLAAVLLPVGAVVVVLRTATPPALNYGSAVFDTGISVVPVDIVRQLLRGPALLGFLVAAHLLLAS